MDCDEYIQVPPPGKGAMYIRPLLMGSGPVLGVAPASEYTFITYASPVGNYHKVRCLIIFDRLLFSLGKEIQRKNRLHYLKNKDLKAISDYVTGCTKFDCGGKISSSYSWRNWRSQGCHQLCYSEHKFQLCSFQEIIFV